MSEISKITIPLDYAKNMDEVAEFILKNRCKQNPDKATVTGYKQAMEQKGSRSLLDLKTKDVRRWPRLRQALSNTIVVKASDLPACPMIEEVRKPEIKVVSPASLPVTGIKPPEPKIEVKAANPPVKTKAATKVKKEDRKVFIP
jgi:hypothetical protein